MEVTMNQILMTIMAAGVVLGGADRLLGNKFGYGDKFEVVIYTDVHTEDHVRGDHFRSLHCVMDIKAHVMCAAVPHIGSDLII